MKNFKVKLKNKSSLNKFYLELIYEPKEGKEATFSFGNSSGSLERSSLEFLDENMKTVEPVGFIMPNPIKKEKTEYRISKTKPFVYPVIGSVKHLENKVHIQLISAEYLLNKDKKYFVKLNYEGDESNTIELRFN